MDAKSWYANGLRFKCTSCGACCKNHGDYTFVYLTERELEAIPKFLGISRREFLAKYASKEPGHWPTLRMDQPACPFLKEDNLCAIYPVRPKQCATWPFWEENLVEETWKGSVTECCPGIGQGELVPAEEVERIARETEEWFEG